MRCCSSYITHLDVASQSQNLFINQSRRARAVLYERILQRTADKLQETSCGFAFNARFNFYTQRTLSTPVILETQ